MFGSLGNEQLAGSSTAWVVHLHWSPRGPAWLNKVLLLSLQAWWRIPQLEDAVETQAGAS